MTFATWLYRDTLPCSKPSTLKPHTRSCRQRIQRILKHLIICKSCHVCTRLRVEGKFLVWCSTHGSALVRTAGASMRFTLCTTMPSVASKGLRTSELACLRLRTSGSELGGKHFSRLFISARVASAVSSSSESPPLRTTCFREVGTSLTWATLGSVGRRHDRL